MTKYAIYSVRFEEPYGFSYDVGALNTAEALEKAKQLALIDIEERSADDATREKWRNSSFALDYFNKGFDTIWV